jgi:predicted phosphodiesterase
VKLGLVTDIHEHVPELSRALGHFDRQRVDRILCLGDVVERGTALAETVALLAARDVAGVWGNHDFGLCNHPSALVSWRRAQFAGPVLDYLATFRPSLQIEDCFFSHVEPWRDLNDVLGLWYFDGPPDTPEKAGRSFAACDARVLVTGHLHRWLVTTPQHQLAWDGRSPIHLERPERYLVVVAAVCEGWCAVYDTERCELVPIPLGA